MTDNVVPFRPSDNQGPDDEELKRRREFNVLWGKYLAVASQAVSGENRTDRSLDAVINKQSDLIWKIIRTPAPLDYHLNYKFQLMRDIMDKQFFDGRHRARWKASATTASIPQAYKSGDVILASYAPAKIAGSCAIT